MPEDLKGDGPVDAGPAADEDPRQAQWAAGEVARQRADRAQGQEPLEQDRLEVAVGRQGELVAVPEPRNAVSIRDDCNRLL